jgi:hypothetical protein
VRSPVCSTDAIRHAGQRAIGGQSVRLSANSLRQEQRSTDGQMILTVGPAGWKFASDLLVCGAPLRNRTVDLLLTMEIDRLSNQHCFESERALTCNYLRWMWLGIGARGWRLSPG